MPRLHVFFFSWGTLSLLVRTVRLEDDTSEGCWVLALGSLFFYLFLSFFCCFFLLFFFFGFLFFLHNVSKVLGRTTEDIPT